MTYGRPEQVWRMVVFAVVVTTVVAGGAVVAHPVQATNAVVVVYAGEHLK